MILQQTIIQLALLLQVVSCFVLLKRTYRPTNLHHQQKRIENDQHHNEIFKQVGHHDSPHFVLEAVPIFRHVPFEWNRIDGEVYTRFLRNNFKAVD